MRVGSPQTSFGVCSSRIRNEYVTNELQRTSAGRLWYELYQVKLSEALRRAGGAPRSLFADYHCCNTVFPNKVVEAANERRSFVRDSYYPF